MSACSSLQTELTNWPIDMVSMHELYKIWGPELTQIRAKRNKYCLGDNIAKADCMQ